MRTKAFVVVLSALLVLVFGMTAMAQVSHNVTAANTQVVYKGMREVLGGISLTASTPTTTQGGSIYITFTKPFTNTGGIATVTPTPVTNGMAFVYPNGMVLTVRETVGTKANGYVSSAAWAITSVTKVNNNTQTQVVISVPDGLTVAALDQISLDGIRADVSDMNVGDNVWAYMSSIPSQANTYNPANIIVATVQPNFTFAVEGGAGVLCVNAYGTSANLTITEGFAGAFVQHVTASGIRVPPAGRPPYGGNANTGFRFTVTGLPAGVTANWAEEASYVVNGTTVGMLTLVGDFEDGVAIYEYSSPAGQPLADQFIEVFDIPVTFDVDPTTAEVGTATVQAQMLPTPPSSSSVPLFKADPKNIPADTFFTMNRCVTYLLYPFVAHGGGFDTGIAIANTSFDSGVFPTNYGATPQTGGATLFYFKAFSTGGTAVAPLAYPISVIEAGNTWALAFSVMNNTVAGFANSTGYIIAKCAFQNAHGFAYISYNMAASTGVAQAYTAKVILDPVIKGYRATTTTRHGGESLGE
jgi:hypothetical protein